MARLLTMLAILAWWTAVDTCHGIPLGTTTFLSLFPIPSLYSPSLHIPQSPSLNEMGVDSKNAIDSQASVVDNKCRLWPSGPSFAAELSVLRSR